MAHTHSGFPSQRPASSASLPRRQFAVVLAAFLAGVSAPGAFAQNLTDPALAKGKVLHSEIVFTDSEAAVLLANPATGPTVLSAGQRLVRPLGICMGRAGEL